VPFSIKITAQDASNNTVTSFNGTVGITSNRTIAGAPLTSDSFVNGVLSSQSLTLTTAGTGSTITATKTGGGPSTISNAFTVYSADGSGSATATPTSVRYGSSGNTITLTYTAAAGGMSNGAVSVVVPSGWSDPSLVGTDPGFTKTNYGTISIGGPGNHTITVTTLNRAAGEKVTITYGAKSSGGLGATAPSTAGSAAWPTQEKSVSGGTLTNVVPSPSITVLSQDGSGTLDPSPSSVIQATSGNTITFTYTAAAGGMNNGSLVLVVPTGWSAPSTTSGTAGYTTVSTGTASVSGRTVTVSGVTLSEGQTLTIIYGSTAGGSPGATAPSTIGPQLWTTKQRSNSAGILTALLVPTVVTVTL
jgi:hypothetical protein